MKNDECFVIIYMKPPPTAVGRWKALPFQRYKDTFLHRCPFKEYLWVTGNPKRRPSRAFRDQSGYEVEY